MASSPILRLKGLTRYLSFTSFDTSTEAGRNSERLRRVALTALASALARGTSIATGLISVPLTLHYLGAERYGMWMTMSAFTAMLMFADFGIGNGVMSVVARATGQDDPAAVRRYVSSGFVMLSGVGLVIMAGMAVVYPYVDWGRVFNVTSPIARAEAGPAIMVFVASFALTLPAAIVQRVQIGLQMGFVASLWQCAASLAGLCGVLFAVWMRAGLPWLVGAFAGIPVLVGVVNTLVFFGRRAREFAPSWRVASRRDGTELAQVGFLFFVLQAAVAVTYTSDNVVIAQKLGAAQVAQFAVPDRLFAIASTLVSLAVQPLWPAFGEALARGDRAWARRVAIRATIASVAVAAGISLPLVLFGRAIIHFWVGDSVQPTLALLLGFALWRTIEAGAGATAMYLNGLRAVRFQTIIAVVLAVTVIVFELLLVKRYGVAVLPWVTSVAYIVCAAIPVAIYVRRHG